jgi:WD40 repeat protein
LTLEEILSSLPIREDDLDENNSAKAVELGMSVQKEKANIIIKKKKPPRSAQHAPNRYCFVTRDELLITTSFGKVFLGSIMQPYGWHELNGPSLMEQDLMSYSVVLGIPEHGTAFLAGANGTIYMYRHGEDVKKIYKACNKVAALFNVSRPGANPLCALITTLGSAEVRLLSVQPPLSQPSILNEPLALTLPPKFIVTSAGNIRGLLVLGSRDGSLAVYDHESSNEHLHIFNDEESQNNDAITAIINIPSTSASLTNCHFLITRRNGSYYIFSLLVNRVPNVLVKKISLALVHQSVPPLGPMIEAAWFHDSNLMLYGFRSKSFMVWNETKRCEVTSIECGGAHRSYAYSPLLGADGAGHFAYTKASKLHLHSQSRASHTATKRGGHGREIKACAVLDGEQQKLVATGAEDTKILIWSHVDNQQHSGHKRDSFQCHTVITKHTVGIQHLQWCRHQEQWDDVHYLFSAGGNEEFYVWTVSSIPGFGLGVVCEATLTDQSEERDLRIMNFDVVAIATPHQATPLVPTFRLTLAYSDSTIKMYEYSRSNGFRRLAYGRYTTHCLTQIGTLRTRDGRQGQDQDLLLFTAATDGFLALWGFRSPLLHGPSELGSGPPPTTSSPSTSSSSPATEPSEPPPSSLALLTRYRLHQSSISALAILPLAGAYIVATGGDDNALSLALLCQRAVVQRIVMPAAHAAAVTGVGFVGCHRGGVGEGEGDEGTGGSGYSRHVLVTVGGDQRVKRWWVEVLGGEGGAGVGYLRIGRLEDGHDTWCSVADAAGLVAFRTGSRDSHCLVYGAGMEMFKVASDGG